MPIYMGGCHRTTDLSLTANTRGGHKGMKAELQRLRWGKKVNKERKLQHTISQLFIHRNIGKSNLFTCEHTDL